MSDHEPTTSTPTSPTGGTGGGTTANPASTTKIYPNGDEYTGDMVDDKRSGQG